jgi:hypothetical protein
MAPDLTTTNILLGIMAAVGLLESIAVAGVLLAAFLLLRRVGQVVSNIEDRHVNPAMARVNAILDDVKGVTATIREDTGRVDKLVDWLLELVGRRRRHDHQPSSTKVM